MRFPVDVPVKIVQLGAGGTGGHAAPHLYRLLYSLERPARLILCDGDAVEAKNLVRQNFSPADLGENKAKVLAERYATVFGMEAEYVPFFIEDLDTLMELITPNMWRPAEGYPQSKTERNTNHCDLRHYHYVTDPITVFTTQEVSYSSSYVVYMTTDVESL